MFVFESSDKYSQDVCTISEQTALVSPELISLHQSRSCHMICEPSFYCQILMSDESMNQLRERLFDITIPVAAGQERQN